MESNLKCALTKSQELSWDHSVFVPTDCSISPETDILIVSDDEDEIEIEKLGYKYMLAVSDVQDIVSNLESQIGAPDITKYIEALNYYVKNDAFITFE